MGTCQNRTVRMANMETNEITETVNILECFPNPFASKTNLQFSSPGELQTTVELCTITGTRIEVVYDEVVQKNKKYTIEYDAINLAGGIYFYKLSNSLGTIYKRIAVIK